MARPETPQLVLDVVQMLGAKVLHEDDSHYVEGAAAAEVLGSALTTAFNLGGWHSPDALAGIVRAAFARSNDLLDLDAVGEHLAEIADKATGSLRTALLTGDGDFAQLADLLACLSALTDVCGYPRTPTSPEVCAALAAETGMSATDLLLGRPPAGGQESQAIVHASGPVRRPAAAQDSSYWPGSDTRLRALVDSVLGDTAKTDAVMAVIDAVVGPRLAANTPPPGWEAQTAAHAAYMHAAKLARDLAKPAPASPAGPGITPDMLGRMADLLEGRAAEAVAAAPGSAGEVAASAAGFDVWAAEFGAYDVFRRLLTAVRGLTREQAERLEAAADAAYDTDDTDADGYRKSTPAERAYRAAVDAGRWATNQQAMEEAPGAAHDVKLAALTGDLISPEDYAALTGPWFATFGRDLWDDGRKAAGQ